MIYVVNIITSASFQSMIVHQPVVGIVIPVTDGINGSLHFRRKFLIIDTSRHYPLFYEFQNMFTEDVRSITWYKTFFALVIGINCLSHFACHLAHSLRIIVYLYLLAFFNLCMLLGCLNNQVCHVWLNSLNISWLNMDMSLIKDTSGIQIVRHVTQASRSLYYIRYSLGKFFCPVFLSLVIRKQLVKNTAISHLLDSVLHIIDIDSIISTSLFHVLSTMDNGMLHSLCCTFLAHVSTGHFCQILHHLLFQCISLRIGLCWVNFTLIQVQIGLLLLQQVMFGQPVLILAFHLLLLLLFEGKHIWQRVFLVLHGCLPFLIFMNTIHVGIILFIFHSDRHTSRFLSNKVVAFTPVFIELCPFLFACFILINVVEHWRLWVLFILACILPFAPFLYTFHVLNSAFALLLAWFALTCTIR